MAAKSSDERLLKDFYQIKHSIGKGSFGEVFACLSKRNSRMYAVKVITEVEGRTTREDVVREIGLCKTLDHKNVLQLIDSFSFHDIPVHYLVFEIMWGGNILDDISLRRRYTERDARNVMQQVFQGVSYLHSRNIMHRDLKPDNLLLSTKDEEAVVKIADFGLALITNGRKRGYGFRGTLRYCAPEIIEGNAYGLLVDMWSCGVVLYIALVGRCPFKGILRNTIPTGVYTYPARGDGDSVCDEAKDLIRKLLNLNQDERLTAEEALQHPFISQLNSADSELHRSKTIENIMIFNVEKRNSKSEAFPPPSLGPRKRPPKSKSDGAIVVHTPQPAELQSTVLQVRSQANVSMSVTLTPAEKLQSAVLHLPSQASDASASLSESESTK